MADAQGVVKGGEGERVDGRGGEGVREVRRWRGAGRDRAGEVVEYLRTEFLSGLKWKRREEEKKRTET